MAFLHIALEEGFEDDTVIVKVDGREVFHEEHVKTRLQIGRAATRDVPIGEAPLRVEILVPQKNLSETVQVQTSNKVYMYVSIVADKIDYRISDEPSSFYA